MVIKEIQYFTVNRAVSVNGLAHKMDENSETCPGDNDKYLVCLTNSPNIFRLQQHKAKKHCED